MNEPPSIPLPPMGVRYPLYADEVSTLAVEPEETLLIAPLHFAEPAPARPRRAAGIVAVAAALVLLVGIALLGWRLLATHHAHARMPAYTTSAATPQHVAVSAAAPITAPPGVDTQGNAVTYAAANMLDGKASTAWRMLGDGTGTTLTFTLARPTTVTSVGLVNGYAKTEGGMDWYAGNRRVLKVSWTFDDGTVVPQTLHSSRDLQRVAVPHVRTGTVKLTLLQVSKPGTGPSSRDATAVSEVQITTH